MLRSVALKAQDVLVACKLYSLAENVRPASSWTYQGLSGELGISLSETYNALERCRLAQLVVTVRDKEVISKRHFYELLAVAVPRIFCAARGGLEVGLPTSVHAPSLRSRFENYGSGVASGVLPTVWSCEREDSPSGLRVRGESISPIYPSVPEAAAKDPLLYELLALVDVVRIGDTRSRNAAVAILERKILGRGPQAQGSRVQGSAT
jgi:hypothetical protein